jgi:hypothetical protein
LGVLAPLAGFGAIAEEIVRHQVFAWDLQVLEVLHARTTPMLNMIMIFITHAGDVQIVGGLVLIALFGLWWLGLERNAIFFRPLERGRGSDECGPQIVVSPSTPGTVGTVDSRT